MTHKQKVINGLYSLAVADAVGNKFEFQSNIHPYDVTAYANTAEKLYFTDDTQMTLFGFEAMTNVEQVMPVRLGAQFVSAYLDWFKTQNSKFDPRVKTGLLQFNEMFEIEAPGETCLESLYCIKNNLAVNNESMGCGSVMRLLPIMLMQDKIPFLHLVYLGSVTAAITHRHIENTRAVNAYVKAASEILSGTYVNQYTHIDRIDRLGLGWIAPECVSMAIWSYEQADTFDELLEVSIAHDGDSDSVAAVAGSLWGLSGKKVPQKYIDKLYGLNTIKYIVDNL